MDIQNKEIKTAQEWKSIGNQAVKQKQYRKAIQAYTQAISIDNTDFSFYSNRAICYYNIQQFDACIQDCKKCQQLKPNFAKILRRKGMAYTQILKFNQAITAYKQAYQAQKLQAISNQIQQAQSYKSNYQRFKVHMQKSQFTDALKCVNYLLGKISKSQHLKMLKVQALAKTGDTTQAQTLIKTIPLANSSNPDFWYLKGIIQLYDGQSARAKKFFTEGMRLDPDNNKCRIALNKAKKCQILKQEGNQFIKNAKYQQACAKYSQAIQLDPANKKLNSIIYSNRALTWMKRKQNLKALEDLNKSLQLNPNYSKSLVRRAEVNMARGQYTAATMDYNKIQQLDPSCDMRAKIKQAQKLERQSKKKDYYKILQVDRNASDDQIKKSYRKLAMKFHPDRNSSKTQLEQQQASKKFKQIAQAYGVLSDPKKKQLYDSGQMQYDGDQGMGGFHSGGMGGMDPNDIFKMFFGGGMGGMGGMRGGRTRGTNGTSSFSFNFG